MTKNKILIVDDEISILNSLERLLKHNGYDTVKASSGAQALEELEKQEFALIICDQMMPVMKGSEVLSQARKISPATIRVTLTGHSDLNSLLNSINEGQIFRLMLKPWDNQALLDLVKEAITQYTVFEENRELQKLIKERNIELEELNLNLEKKVKDRTKYLLNIQNELRYTLRGIVKVLSKMLEMHSEGLCGHGERVAKLSRKIAEHCYRKKTDSSVEIDIIETAAFIHDIGKISISPEILKKEEWILSKYEKKLISQHPLAGHELLKDIRSFNSIAKIILHQHEKYTGLGFPSKLRGNSIPLGARVIALANKYDSYTHPISGISMPPASAAIELSKLKGIDFDPDLTEILLRIITPMQEALKDEDEEEVPMRLLKSGMELSRDVLNINNGILLKAGTVISDEILLHLASNDTFNPVKSRIFIVKDIGNEVVTTPKLPVESEDKKNDKPVIVAIDDEINVLNSLKRELRKYYNVECFTKVSEAFMRIKRKDVFAVISDFNMPGVKGADFIHMVQRECPDIPCFILTGAATRENVLTLTRKCKPVHIFTKPWDKEELLKALNNQKVNKDGKHNR